MATTKIGNIEMDVETWGKIKGHICSRGYKKISLWIVEAMKEKWLREISPKEPREIQAQNGGQS